MGSKGVYDVSGYQRRFWKVIYSVDTMDIKLEPEM